MSMPPLNGHPWPDTPSTDATRIASVPGNEKDQIVQAEGYRHGSNDTLFGRYDGGDGRDGGNSSSQLQKSLKSRHITMIAIGGAVGTGLIIGTGQALARAGPGSVLVAYTIVGFLVYLVMCALGEMAAWLPIPSGFTGYAARFCDPALGFALGWTYYFKYIVSAPNNLTALALVMQYWVSPERVNPGIWVTIALLLIIVSNFFGVRLFGELQFWLSSAKVLVFLGLMILSIVIAAGGGPDHQPTGFKYWKNPGAFRPYLDTDNEETISFIDAGEFLTREENHVDEIALPVTDKDFGKFLGVWSAMINAVFAYLGTELVGVTVGEAENPRKSIPSAIKLTFWRILFFYVGSVFLVGLLVPYDSEALAFATKEASSSASASPFVVAIQIAGIDVLPGFINGCIVLFILSGAMSDLYIATRTVYGLAVERSAPAFLARTNATGTPIYALACSSAFCLLAYMTVSKDSREVFSYFVNLVAMFGLLTWISILVTHIYFVRGRRAQNIPDETMPFRAPLGIWGSYVALGFSVLIALTKHFAVFACDPETGRCFSWRHFLTGYLGIPLYLIFIFGHKFVKGSRPVRPAEADFLTGKAEVDAEEREFVERARAEREARGERHWFYRNFVAWLF